MSDSQVIPEAAVEAAARSICDALSMTKWEDQGPLTRDVYRSHARAAFAAAAPHMLAGAWDDGWYERAEDDGAQRIPEETPNPHRPAE